MTEKPDIVERLRRDQYKECDCWRCVVCEDAAAEIERLRAALRTIQTGKIQADNEHPLGPWASMGMRFHEIAHAALNPPA